MILAAMKVLLVSANEETIGMLTLPLGVWRKPYGAPVPR